MPDVPDAPPWLDRDERHTWMSQLCAAPGHVREARRLVFDVLTPEQVEQVRDIAQAITAAASPEVAGSLREAIASSDQL